MYDRNGSLADNPSDAWGVSFNGGFVYFYNKQLYVAQFRAVRVGL